MERFNNLKEFTLKYILYFFPLLIILGNAVVNFAFVLIFLLYFSSCLIEKKIVFRETYEFKYFFFFYIYLILNSLLAENVVTSLTRSIPYVKYFIFVLIFKSLIEDGKINIKRLGYFWFFIILFLSLDIIYQSIYGYDIFNYVSIYESRNSGFFFDELVAGGFLVSFVFLTIFLIKKQNNNNFFYLIIVFFTTVVFLTGERANFLDFLLILICVYVFCIKTNLLFKFLSIIISILILSLLISNFDSFKGRYLSSISYSENTNLNLLDTYLTSEYGSHSLSSLLIFKDNFLFGVGNKNFRISCNKYKNEVIEFQKKKNVGNPFDLDGIRYPGGCATHPHQIYNEFLSEHGLIGTILILFIIYKLIFKSLSFQEKNNLNIVCLFYIIIHFIPILPSGSFFSTLPSTFFWTNYLFYIANIKNND